jgi:hypothetical protein
MPTRQVWSAFETRRTSECGFTPSKMSLRMLLAPWRCKQERGRRQLMINNEISKLEAQDGDMPSSLNS